MNDIRRNGIVGLIEYENWGIDKHNYLHFSEWWNGEGMDYTFSSNNEELKISLHLDDIQALVTSAIASGYVDVDECVRQAAELNRASEERRKQIQEFADNYGGV